MGYKSGAKRHTHKYWKGNYGLWACGFPDCTHFMPTNISFTMEGRGSICWSCGELMILSRANLKQEKPICDECHLKSLGFVEDAETIIEKMIQQKTEENNRKQFLNKEESAVIKNKPDDDCMTPNVCTKGIIEIMCDNCREKLSF